MGHFDFREFSIDDGGCGMKLGTDSVLLGAWFFREHSQARSVLDIGAGSGILSLMAAQLCPAAGITGVEIDSAAASAAGANFQASPWASRLEVVNADINTFGSTGAYQLIVSNPPYYSNGAVSTDDSRAGARHQNSLTFGNLLEAVGRLIAADGCFAMVTPPDAEADILFAAELSRLYLRRLCRVATTPARPCRRLLWEFSRSVPGRVSEQTLLLRGASGQPSREYSSLVDGFYLRIH